MILAKIASLFFSEFVIVFLPGPQALVLGRRRSDPVQWRYHQRIIPELDLDGCFPAGAL